MKKGISRFFYNGLVLLLGCVLVSGCAGQASQSLEPGKMKVVATIYPVYEFARQIGGDKVDVQMLLQPGTEPHDWEPTPQELARIKTGKLFLYHGAGLEPVEKILNKDVLGMTQAVAISKEIVLRSKEDSLGSEKSHDADHDIHTWLDPVNAQQEVRTIAAAFIEMDPQNTDYYRKNAEIYCQELVRLDEEYRRALTTVKRREIITSHAAFGYLAQRYELHPTPIMGLSPDSEPTAEKMAAVVEFCRKNQVKYIFFETLVSPKLAKTIAKETGAGLLILNPLESLTSEEMKQGKNYLVVMRENLANLCTALQE